MSQTHLYRHFNSDNELLYIGIAKDAVARLRAHSSEWKWLVARSEITMFPTREAAIAAEAKAIPTERPKYNVIHLPYGDRVEQHHMTKKQYRDAIAGLGLSQGRAAEFLDVSIRTSNSYANGAHIPHDTAALLSIMVEMKLSTNDVNLLVDKYQLRLG